MSYASSLNSAGLLNWAARSVAELSQRRAEINALNVFPVPDADTGSNMAHTMEAALEQARRGGEVAEALAIGSVRGARGNSGMVLSQVLSGVANASHGSEVDAKVFSSALDLAVDLVDRAIAEPVEGTIITVLRAAAAEAHVALEEGLDLHGLLVRVTEVARVALDNTPSQLAVLREAGVVDAGGAGLVILLECMLAELEGRELNEAEALPTSMTELEVVFFFEGNVSDLEERLRSMGDSLVVARVNEESGSVHIHSAQAGKVIELAFSLGSVSNLRLEVLPECEHGLVPAESSVARRVIVAAPPGPVAEIFHAAGAEIVPPDAVRIKAEETDVFLDNGAKCDPDKAQVVHTDSLVAGIAAISVYEPDADTVDVVSAMTDAANSMRVAKPQASTTDAVVVAARQLLAAGGEQVTVLSPNPVDEKALTKRLGVEVMALRAPGVDVEVGVE